MKIHCKYDALVPLTQLVPFEKNRNQHTEAQIERLAFLMRKLGVRAPIVVANAPFSCVAKGHGTISAFKLNKWTEAPVVYQDFKDYEELYQFVQSDNAIAAWAELDLAGINLDLPEMGPFNIDLLGIENFTVDMAEKDGEDEVGDKPVSARSKPGELYLLGGSHRLLCGDSTDRATVERLMNGEKADMVFTSPPYSDLREYGGDLDLDPVSLCKLFDWPSRLYVVNLGLIIRQREIVPYWNIYLDGAKARELKLLSWNIWDKEQASAPAHQQAMFGLSHEWIFVFGEYRQLNLTKPNKEPGGAYHGKPSVREKDGSLSKRDGAGYKVRQFRQLDTVINLTRQHNYASDFLGDHPAVFPVHLPESYIEAVTNTGELICDPFLGSGSTLIACEKTNRRCFGMEIDPQYIDVIIARFQKFTGKQAVREDGVKWDDLPQS